MKKIGLLLILVTLCFQEGFSQMFGWGINLGAGFSTISGTYETGKPINDAEVIPGYVLGGFFKYRPRRFFSAVSGFNYVLKGTNINSNRRQTKMGTTNAQLRATYFEVPILLQLNFNPYSSNRPNIYVGPSLSWQVTMKDNFTIDYYGTDIPERQEVGKYYTNFDPGLIIGAGIDLDVGEWSILSLGMRYTHGFNDITIADGVFVREPFEMKNRHFALTMVYTWVTPTFTFNNPVKNKNDRKKFKSQKPSKY